MGKPMTPTITATLSSDTYIPLDINGISDNSNNTVDRLYISRWNQVDNTWGGEYRHDSATYNGDQPGTETASNRRYRWRVRGWRSDYGFGDFGYSDYVQTTPRAPTGASAGLSGPVAISVSWNDTAYEPYYEYNTEIWWNINGGGWGHFTTVAAGTTSYYFSGLTAGATYQFGIRHVETYGPPTIASGFNYTGVVTALTTPAAPSSVGATRNSDAQATITWTNNASGGAPYDSLTLQRWDNVGNAWGTIANLSGTATTATDSGLVAGRKYQWRIAANNSVGSSGWGYSGNVFTTPAAPSNVTAAYTGGTTVKATWQNNVSYTEYGVRLQAYKNGVADGAVVSLNSGTTTYDKTGVDNTASYYFKVWAVSDVGALASTQTQSNSVTAATAPGTPTGLASSAPVIDVGRTHSVSWTHTPSNDGSAQRQYQIRHRLVGAGTWTERAVVTSAVSSITDPLSAWGYTNNKNVEWQVRTWGVHANPSPYSASHTVQTSAVPTVNITSPGTTITTSVIDVAWSYFDAEGTAQAEWKVDLYESASGNLLESKSGTDTASSLTLAYSATDGVSYRVEVAVRDGSGLWSDKAVKTFEAAFLPPAEVLLDAELDSLSGAAILTLTRTPDDGGVTTFPASAVTIERQFYDSETETWGEWETLIAEADPDAVLIDTTGPAHDDGQYRIITHSTAPTTYRPAATITPPPIDNRWLYVSGGPRFDVICKMWANIEISQSASRAKALHYFAGRRHPVIYSGEAAERTFTVSGILEDEASPPQQWIRLAREAGAVLLRAPGRRMYGSLSGLSVDRIQHNLHKVSFSIQEVTL